jgi:hypothetical protein
MSGAIPPPPQYAFMAWYLVKHRDNFTFYKTSSIAVGSCSRDFGFRFSARKPAIMIEMFHVFPQFIGANSGTAISIKTQLFASFHRSLNSVIISTRPFDTEKKSLHKVRNRSSECSRNEKQCSVLSEADITLNRCFIFFFYVTLGFIIVSTEVCYFAVYWAAGIHTLTACFRKLHRNITSPAIAIHLNWSVSQPKFCMHLLFCMRATCSTHITLYSSL